jgi:hypothetical protein
MSKDDLEKGTVWVRDLAATLDKTDVGIICVTRENMNSPWLLFEAGALAKKEKARVMPYLLDTKPGELVEPLRQFNAVCFDKDDTRRMVGAINSVLGGEALAETELDASFEMWWPNLEDDIKKIPSSPKAPEPPPPPDAILPELSKKVQFILDILAARPLAPDGIGLVRERPKHPIVGKCEHFVNGAKSVITLHESGWINDPSSRASWRLEGNRLTLIWPNSDAQVGAWIDRCTLSPDGTAYSGRNQVGAVIEGRKLPDG